MPSLLSPIGIANFTGGLFEASATKGGKPRYSVTMVFDPAAQKTPAFEALTQAIADAIKAKFPTSPPRGLVTPIRNPEDLDSLADKFPDGSVFVRFNSTTKPSVLDQRRQPLGPEGVYSGCYGRVAYVCGYSDHEGTKRVNCYLNGFQFAHDGEPLGGGRAASPDEFEDLPMDEDSLADVDF